MEVNSLMHFELKDHGFFPKIEQDGSKFNNAFCTFSTKSHTDVEIWKGRDSDDLKYNK